MKALEASPASLEELQRAARLLTVRSRREVSSAFAGSYRSAFRGGGMEFEESRPYAPGDDVRSLDWNAMARTGAPYVKHFREERDQVVLLAVDTSSSMRFGTAGRAKAALAAHTAALIAGAARRARDRIGLITFDETIRQELRPARSDAHIWRLLRRLVLAAGAPQGGTDLAAVMARLRTHTRRRAVVVILSDFRDDGFLEGRRPEPGAGSPRAELVALARQHDVVAAVIDDPRDRALPAVGALRVADPERPGRSVVLRTGSRRLRERYRLAAEVRSKALERRLRADGADVLRLRTDRDPLHDLAHFFQHRGALAARARR